MKYIGIFLVLFTYNLQNGGQKLYDASIENYCSNSGKLVINSPFPLQFTRFTKIANTPISNCFYDNRSQKDDFSCAINIKDTDDTFYINAYMEDAGFFITNQFNFDICKNEKVMKVAYLEYGNNYSNENFVSLEIHKEIVINGNNILTLFSFSFLYKTNERRKKKNLQSKLFDFIKIVSDAHYIE
ncbi:MAG: hypothetical protein R3E32_09250 [Chitinophagales bacterium]